MMRDENYILEVLVSKHRLLEQRGLGINEVLLGSEEFATLARASKFFMELSPPHRSTLWGRPVVHMPYESYCDVTCMEWRR